MVALCTRAILQKMFASACGSKCCSCRQSTSSITLEISPSLLPESTRLTSRSGHSRFCSSELTELLVKLRLVCKPLNLISLRPTVNLWRIEGTTLTDHISSTSSSSRNLFLCRS